MEQKRLFQITDTKTKRPVPGLYFADKQLAKMKRRELNNHEETPPLRYIVSPGPDHVNCSH
jgi:hypothetical protein